MPGLDKEIVKPFWIGSSQKFIGKLRKEWSLGRGDVEGKKK